MTVLMNKKAEIKNRIDLINRGEVPEGYKCCWGYIYPESWNIKSLKDLFYKVKTKNTANESLPVLTNSATLGVILQDEYFDREIVNDENTNNYYIVENGDFMYNPRISSNAPAGPINRNTLGQKGIASPLYTIFRAKDTKNIEFVEKYFKSNYWHRYMKSVSNQGARHDRLNINDEDFMRMPIPQPSKQEQEKIAKILNCCDKVIELKQQLLVEIINIKKYIVDKILIKNVQKDKVQEVKLKDISRFITKGTTPNRFEKHSDIKFIKIESIVNGKIDNSKCSHISRNTHDNELSRSKLQENDILFGIAGALGVCTKVEKKNLPANTNQALAIIRLNDVNSIDYVIEVLKSPIMKKYIHSNNVGCAQVNLNLEQISNFKFKLPCKISQILIIKLFKNMNKKIELLSQELEQYKQLKKSLSQLLLTGIVRTVEVDCEN